MAKGLGVPVPTAGPRMVWGVVLILLTIITSGIGQDVRACPHRCVCFRTTVRCMFLHLHKIPDVPKSTTELDLRFNRIREIPPGAFKEAPHLETLILNNNNIKKIKNGAFEGLTELQSLYLYKNEIASIESRSFEGLTKLELLYIHSNKIIELKQNTFTNLPSLERLFLHDNQLTTLPKGVFSSLKNLRRLRLDSNALVCDCQLMWLSEVLKDKNSEQTPVMCQGPADMQGKSLLSLTHEHLHCKKPTITTNPQDVDVSFGNRVHFSCRAEGDPIPEISWLHNDREIVTNTIHTDSRYNILDDGTLTIEDAKDTDSGSYLCVARNTMGETKGDAAQLRYADQQPVRPEIVQGPKDYSVALGEDISLHCVTQGSPRPRLTWTKNDLPLSSDPRIEVTAEGTLNINSLLLSDRGLYRCTATNTAGVTTDFSRLEVVLPPEITRRPRDQQVVEGHSAFFSCDASGNPTPRIRWHKDGIALPQDPRLSVNPSGTTLTISNIISLDHGSYECIVESSSGRTSASAQLVVSSRVPPTLRESPRDAHAPRGSTVEFSCLASGDPTPTIKWLRNSIPLNLLTDPKYHVNRDGSLLIRDVQVADAGEYECVAENVVGTTRAFSRLRITESGFTQHIGPDPFRPDPSGPSFNNHLHQIVDDSNRRVGVAINNTIRDLRDPNRRRTPADLLRLVRFPSRSAVQISRAAEVFEQALETLHREQRSGIAYNISHNEVHYEDLLSPTQLAVVAGLSGCAEHRRIISCDDMCYHRRYRTYDGTCNNLEHPMWGASLVALNRLVPPEYDNGFNLPIGWDPQKLYNGYRLPSARVISIKIASTSHITEDVEYSHMLMQWGQFTDHDMDFVPQAVSNARFSDGRFCNETCDYGTPCFPIEIPDDDPRVRHRRCIGTTRSSAMCGSGLTSVFFNKVFMREQINQITSYIDGSNVYGSSDEEARNLRDFTTNRGLLRTGIAFPPNGKPLLPPNTGEPIDCQMDPNRAHVPCFQAGDHRANEQLGLLSMHTIWMREHNRVAIRLSELNTHWDGDTMYHEARKIIGAQLQHITYRYWLPKILGPYGMKIIGNYSGYNPNTDSTILNDFATAAFRFGHSLINPIMYRLNDTFLPIPEGNLPLHRAFFAPFRILEEGGIDPLLRGMFGHPAKMLTPGELLNTELTEKLFRLAHEVALDLAALNIHRGRDHGLPKYNEYRKHCGLRVANSFEGFRDEISNLEARRKLRAVYGHPDNVEVWVGGLLEDPIEGARIGPTFICIIAEQFKRTRDGDRFWYENPEVFSPSQLTEIKQSTLARVICDNSDGIEEVQKDLFLNARYPQDFFKCESNDIQRINLRLWAHCCYDCTRAGDFSSLTSHFRGKRSADHSYPEQKDEPSKPLGEKTVPLETPHESHAHPISPSHQGTEAHGSNNSEGQLTEEKKDNPELAAMMEEMTKMSHKMMDTVEVRIEGMESGIEQMVHTVKRLTRKLRKLEKQVRHKNLLLPSVGCVDHLGEKRQNRDRWKEHDCRHCECKSGQLECSIETCQVPLCLYPKKYPGHCCPVCQ